jgi:hypothetical protein
MAGHVAALTTAMPHRDGQNHVNVTSWWLQRVAENVQSPAQRVPGRALVVLAG